MSDVRGKSATAMSRTKKPSKLSADERAFLNRIRSLNEEETENLSFDDIIADLNILDKVDPGALRRALEDVLIDRGLTNAKLFQLLEHAKERAGIDTIGRGDGNVVSSLDCMNDPNRRVTWQATSDDENS